jgi:hypothetical protein
MMQNARRNMVNYGMSIGNMSHIASFPSSTDIQVKTKIPVFLVQWKNVKTMCLNRVPEP